MAITVQGQNVSYWNDRSNSWDQMLNQVQHDDLDVRCSVLPSLLREGPREGRLPRATSPDPIGTPEPNEIAASDKSSDDARAKR